MVKKYNISKEWSELMPLEAESGERERSFTGYAWTFQVDSAGDMITPAAFLPSVQKINSGGIPLIMNHNAEDVRSIVGRVVHAQIDEVGLLITGVLSNSPETDHIYSLLKQGMIDSLSIGFTASKGDVKMEKVSGQQVRVFNNVDLHELSLVVVPANSRAKVLAVKTLGETAEEQGKEEAAPVEAGAKQTHAALWRRFVVTQLKRKK